jgi:hypothetical protein
VNFALRYMGPLPYQLVLVGRIVLADGRSPLVEAYGVLDADCVELALNWSTMSARPAKPGAADMSAATRRLAWR